jgi:hypothetical protein
MMQGNSGSGGVSNMTGSGGNGGGMSGMNGGSGSGGSMGGSGAGGSNGGTGGMEGGGGDGPKADCSAAGAAKEGTCKTSAKGVYALKTTLDAYWYDEQNPDAPIVDPGRGPIVIYLMGRIEDICEDGSNGVGVMKACGSELPAFSSAVTCDAYQLQFDPALWDKPTMPTFVTTGSTSGFNAGDTLSLAKAIGLVGVNLTTDDAAWPTAAETGTFACKDAMGMDKTGVDCFPDQDGDGKPGISVALKVGGTYMPPGCSGNGCKCNDLGTDYSYRGSPTSLDLFAGGGSGGGIRAVEVHIGLRTTLGGSGMIDQDCMGGNGPAEAPMDAIQSRAVSCKVDPASLPNGDTSHPDNSCTTEEAIFVDENVPNYHILQKDEKPGNAMVKDQTASVGPQAEMVRLGDLNATFDCAAVRGAFQ